MTETKTFEISSAMGLAAVSFYNTSLQERHVHIFEIWEDAEDAMTDLEMKDHITEVELHNATVK